MAREVNTVLAKIMAEQRGIREAKAEEMSGMRSANQYQVRLSIKITPLTIFTSIIPDPDPCSGLRGWLVGVSLFANKC